MKQLIAGGISVVVVLAGLWQFWGGMSSANSYNAYIEQVKPLLEKQDAVLLEIQNSTDAAGAQKVAGWLTLSKQIEVDLQRVVMDEDWLHPLHQHMIKRAKSFTQMVESSQRFYQNGDESGLAEMEKFAAETTTHLNAFIAERDRLARDKDFEITE